MQNFVFDIYGTLIDIHTDEWSEQFKSGFDRYFRRKLKADVPFMRRYEQLCAQYTADEEPDFIKLSEKIAGEGGANPTCGKLKKIARAFRKKSTVDIRLYEGVKNLLKTLKANGKKLYILSNAQSSFTLYELKRLGIYGLFDGIELSSDFGYKKPSPEFFDHIIKKYALNRADTIYIGNDISCDIIASKAAGLKAAYIKSDISPSADTVSSASEIADFASENRQSLYKYLINL